LMIYNSLYSLFNYLAEVADIFVKNKQSRWAIFA